MSQRKRVQHPSGGMSSQTQQSAEPASNINTIMSRYRQTGVIAGPPGRSIASPRKPFFGDFVGLDFRSMMDTIIDVKNRFMTLPPRLRARFGGDPAQVIRFVEDPQNRAEALKMGLLLPTPEESEKMADEEAAERARSAKEARQAAENAGQQNLVAQVEDAESQPRKGRKA